MPQVLAVRVDTYADLYPKIAFGRPLTEMEPLAQPVPDWDVPDRDYEGAGTP